MNLPNQLILFGLTISLLSCNEVKTIKEVISHEIPDHHSEQSSSRPELNSPEKPIESAKGVIRYKPLNPFGRSESISPEQTESGLKEYLRSLEKKSQDFYINPNQDTLIVCNEGTTLKIKKGSFIKTALNDSVSAEIKLSVKEFYKVSDMIISGLSTQSNNDLLETGGMLFIEAFSEEKACILKEGYTIEIAFPFEQRKDSMQLFLGYQEEGKINWKVSGEKDRSMLSEEYAEFPGGYFRLKRFLEKRIEIPYNRLDTFYIGTISVEFDIDENGKLTVTNIDNGLDEIIKNITLKAFANMPLWKPAKRNGISVKSSRKQLIHFNETFDMAFKNKFEANINDSSLFQAKTSEVSRYLLSTSHLGWINCDRIYITDKIKRDLLVNPGEFDNLDVKLVFKSIRTLLDGTISGTSCKFEMIPVDEEVKLVVIKKLKEKLYVSVTGTNTNVGIVEDLKFEEASIEKLKQKLELLESWN